LKLSRASLPIGCPIQFHVSTYRKGSTIAAALTLPEEKISCFARDRSIITEGLVLHAAHL
jgi:hypothetical protein